MYMNMYIYVCVNMYKHVYMYVCINSSLYVLLHIYQRTCMAFMAARSATGFLVRYIYVYMCICVNK